MTEAPNEYEGSYDPGMSGDYDPDDPFAAPPKAINFSDEWEAGQEYELHILDGPRRIQSFDAKTKKPAFWDDDKTQPKMVAIFTVKWLDETRSLWVPLPSALSKGLREATMESRCSIRHGSSLIIPYSGLDRKAKKPGQNAPHAFGTIVHIPPQ